MNIIFAVFQNFKKKCVLKKRILDSNLFGFWILNKSGFQVPQLGQILDFDDEILLDSDRIQILLQGASFKVGLPEHNVK